MPANAPRTWRETTSQVRFPSRSCSVSPTQTMGWSCASSAARSLRFTPSSVSPKYCRRSLWPRMTPSQPSSASIGALISPVKAPCFSWWQFCAKSWMELPASASLTLDSAVNGGATATWICDSRRCLSSRTSATASAVVLCIFQFPQTNFRRGMHTSRSSSEEILFVEDLHAGEVAALEEFEGGAAAGGDVGDLVGEAHLGDGGRGVAAAHHRARAVAGCLRQRFRHCARPRGELRHLEQAHGPVPEDGLRREDALPVELPRLRADVEPEHALGDLRHRLHRKPALRLLRHQVIGRQEHLDARLRGLVEDAPRHVELVLLHPRGAHPDAARGEEGVRHGAADQERVHLAHQLIDDLDLVAHLGAAEDRQVRLRRALEQRLQVLELRGHEK